MVHNIPARILLSGNDETQVFIYMWLCCGPKLIWYKLDTSPGGGWGRIPHEWDRDARHLF